MKVNELFKKTLIVRFQLTNERSLFTTNEKWLKIGDVVEIHSDGVYNWFVVNGKVDNKLDISKADFMYWFQKVKRKHVEVLYERKNK